MHNKFCNAYMQAVKTVHCTNYNTTTNYVNNVAQLLAYSSVAANNNCAVNVNLNSISITCANDVITNVLFFSNIKQLLKTFKQIAALSITTNMYYVCYNADTNNAQFAAVINKYDCEVD